MEETRVLVALLPIGWQIKHQSGSHRTLSRNGWSDVVFAFYDHEEIEPHMLAEGSRSRIINISIKL